MNSTGFRQAVVDALGKVAEVQAGTWALLDAPPDMVDPPVYVVDWADPMHQVSSMCADQAEVVVVVVAAHFADAAANYPTVEAMVDGGKTELAAAGLRPWQVLRPVAFPLGQLTYLAARMHIRALIDL